MSGDGVTVTLSGVDELLKAFEEIGSIGTRSALQDAMKKGAALTAEAARRYAPVGDGLNSKGVSRTHLRDSIKVMANLSRSQKRKRGGRRHEAEIFVGSTSPHAHLVEFGHLNVKVRRADDLTPTTFTRRVKNKDGSLSLVKVRGRWSRKVISRRIVGHVAARQFMRPAYDATKQQAAAVIFRELGASLVKVARRYRRQAQIGKLTRGSREAFRMELGL